MTKLLKLIPLIATLAACGPPPPVVLAPTVCSSCSGIAYFSNGSRDDEGKSVIVQSDGRIVVAGYANDGGNDQISILRLTTAGALDGSFNGTGTAKGNMPARANAVVQILDGGPNNLKLFVAGAALTIPPAILSGRFNTDGTLDSTFDGDGIASTPTSNNGAQAFSAVQQSDGRIVVAGQDGNNIILIRYNQDGSLDSGFDADGIVTTTPPAGSSGAIIARSVIQQADGKIVVAGSSQNGTRMLFVRYLSTGALDTTFDTDGYVEVAVNNTDKAEANALIQVAGPRLVATGYVQASAAGNNDANDNVVVVRLNDNGSMDSFFGFSGLTFAGLPTLHERGLDIIEQEDGRYAVAGIRASDTALFRFLSNGLQDNSFGTNGTASIQVSSAHDQANSIVEERNAAGTADNKLIVTGYAQNPSSVRDTTVLRLNMNGTLDTSFSP